MALVRKVDEAQAQDGDVKTLSYLEVKAEDRQPVVREVMAYTRVRPREGTRKMVLLVTRPKVERGQGYLVIDRNIFYLDPIVGRWERKTERDGIAGSSVRRSDLESPHYAELYDARCEGEELVNKVRTRRVMLTAKEGADVAFPRVRLWVDAQHFLEVKREDAATSGKPLRALSYLRWQKVEATANTQEHWYCPEFRVSDLVDSRNETMVKITAIDFTRVDDAVFTKPWLEKAGT